MPSAANPYRDQRTQYDPGMGMDELCDALNLGLYIGVTAPSGSAPTISSAIISFLQSGSGASAETLRSRGRWVVYVTDFMSDANRADVRAYGFTNDLTSAFQAAHDALPSSGGDIRVPAGGYLLNQTAQSSQFTISKSNVRIIGDGWGAQLKHTGTTAATGTIQFPGVISIAGGISNIQILNLRLTGPTAASGSAITAGNSVGGIAFHDGTSTGHLTDVLVSGVLAEKFLGPGFAIVSGASGGACKRIKIVNCWAFNTRGDGFNDYGGANNEDITIEGCYAIDCDGFGFEMSTSKGLKLDGNFIRRCGQSGIGIDQNASTSPTNRVQISNNFICDIITTAYPDSSGISLGQSVNPVNIDVIGNTITRVGGHGIELNLSPDNIRIIGNVIQDIGDSGTNTYGIYSGASVTNVAILNNVIKTSTSGYTMDYGIVLAGSGSATNLVAGNDIQGAAVLEISSSSPNRINNGFVPAAKTTVVGNVGTGEDDLMSYSVPANTLYADDMGLHIVAVGTTAANGNNKQVKLYFGGNSILASGAAASNNVAWRMEAYVYRISNTTARAIAWGEFNGALVTTAYTASVSGAMDFAGAAQVVKCTGEATSDNDITQTLLIVRYLDQPSNA